ncbi:hypothetical protein EVU91_04545 [Macrococcoides bohemicum]|uniref:hypothetical protein n=1 Tax=Macrococcoides bohemicum TaxID=1903056 RepID=UPI001059A5A0|nr:hypothetical protein [Macrococcus bohemicus]TDL39418.1 hypothetical protein EVU91_04545 [Macrococcus bohemicus]
MKTLEDYSHEFLIANTPGGDGLVLIHSRFDELDHDDIELLLTTEEKKKTTFLNSKRSEHFQSVSDFYVISECENDGIKLIKVTFYSESNDTWVAILYEPYE